MPASSTDEADPAVLRGLELTIRENLRVMARAGGCDR
jgi:hypothetical protein